MSSKMDSYLLQKIILEATMIRSDIYLSKLGCKIQSFESIRSFFDLLTESIRSTTVSEISIFSPYFKHRSGQIDSQILK